MKTNHFETDGTLLDKARNGDKTAFRMLVERYEGSVAATVIGMLGRTDEAEDVGLEVFVRFYRALDQFRGDANLRTYLTRIAINLSLNELKRRGRRTARFQELTDEVMDVRPTPETDVMHRERDGMVRDAIQQLDSPFRQVVVLRLVEGMTVRETAETLGVPTGTVLSRLSRAQEKLRSIITPQLANYHEHG